MFTTAAVKGPITAQCGEAPADTISDLAWYWSGYQAMPLLAVAGWDGSVVVYEIQCNKPLDSNPSPTNNPAEGASDPRPTAMNAAGKLKVNVGSPATCLVFAQGQALIVGTMDKRVVAVNLVNGEILQVGQHEGPVRRVFYDAASSMILSVSLDRSVCWWRLGTQAPPAHRIALNDFPTDADFQNRLLAVVLEGNHLVLYEAATNYSTPRQFDIPGFTYPLVAVRLFNDNTGCCVSSVEGRARIMNFVTGPGRDDFAFRCHRLTNSGALALGNGVATEDCKVYSANSIDVNPIYGTIATVGGDGHVLTWDKDTRAKLASSERYPQPITAAKFDPAGRLLAIALGYDWGFGAAGKASAQAPRLLVIAVPDMWIKCKPKN